MEVQALLRAQYRQTHEILEAVVDACEPSVLAFVPDGSTVGSIAAVYAHLIFTEDRIRCLGGGAPVHESSRFQALHLPELQQSQQWAQTAEIDLPAFRDYAMVVYAATDDYLTHATAADLDRTVEGFAGAQTVREYVGVVGPWHVASHQGEISALKGAQGLSGLAF
jgi:hypothetical protein